MRTSDYVSDEILNAYIDQELDEIEMMRVQVLVTRNPGLQRRLHVLQQLKIMVHTAKPEGSAALIPVRIGDNKNCCSQVAFGVVTLMFAGWVMWALFPINEYTPMNVTTARGLEQTTIKNLLDSALNHAAVKVVLHIKRSDTQAGKILFEKIDMLLSAAERRQIAVRIEVLANGDGLNLLRQDMSSYAKKIHAIQNQYDNVVFIACGDTIQRRNLSLAELNLFPEVMVVTSVNQQIDLRLTQGWNVIHV
ncbi:MAG TPA: hypothetical protein ENI64_05255 [Gammaproteobacteria bacterium]|nr:hypothetical protein [Gammaproteobacteria bacterium]